MRILHISDVHVQVDYSERSLLRIGWRRAVAQLELQLARRGRRYERAPETLARIVAEAARARVDHVVLSGDLTALAVDEEFEAARRALGALADRPDRLTVIPGNHDVYTPGSARRKRFERWFGHLLHSDVPELCAEGPWPTVRLLGDRLAIIGLSSARPPPLPGIAAGKVGPEQLAALGRALIHPKLAHRAIYVTVHHAPMRPDGRPDRVTHGLRDADALLAACRSAGNVAAILCGHIHHRFQRELPGGTRLVCAGSSTCAGVEGYGLLEDEGGRLASVNHVRLGEGAPADADEAVVEPAGALG